MTQHQTLATKLFAEEAVMSTITMLGIPHDGMKDMGHVPTQLMLTPGLGQQTNQAVTTGRVLGRNCIGQLDRLQPLQLGLCLLRGFIG